MLCAVATFATQSPLMITIHGIWQNALHNRSPPKWSEEPELVSALHLLIRSLMVKALACKQPGHHLNRVTLTSHQYFVALGHSSSKLTSNTYPLDTLLNLKSHFCQHQFFIQSKFGIRVWSSVSGVCKHKAFGKT